MGFGAVSLSNDVSWRWRHVGAVAAGAVGFGAAVRLRPARAAHRLGLRRLRVARGPGEGVPRARRRRLRLRVRREVSRSPVRDAGRSGVSTDGVLQHGTSY